MSGLVTWWQGRSRRERWLLAVLGLVAAAIAWIYGGYIPLQRWEAAAERRHTEALRLHTLALSAPARPAGAPGSRTVQAHVEETGRLAGLIRLRSEARGAGAADVTLEVADARALMRWILGLESQGYVVSRLAASRQGSVLNVSLTVEDPVRSSAAQD